MDEKISQEALAQYADRYAEEVAKGAFTSGKKVTGKEILSLCNVHQVNLFVVRELFRDWKHQTETQRSPYFDYDHPEVKEALTTYMSVLSNHIAIDKEHFMPLLRQGVRQTLMVIFNPYDFYSALISRDNGTLEIDRFREEIKYLKINRAPLEKMLARLDERNLKSIPGNEAFAVLDQILEEVNFTPEDLDGYIDAFSTVVPLNVDDFFVPRAMEKQQPAPEHEVSTATPAQPAKKGTERSTLNDRLNSGKQPTLVDSFRKITSIKESLTINQKFMFTKVLFFGDFESFSRAVDDLDKLSNLDEALQYLVKQSSAWDRESREFHEFMEMIEQRFA